MCWLFGFPHAEEFMVSSAEAYDSETHLNLNDFVLDSHTNPTMARLYTYQTEQDRPLQIWRGSVPRWFGYGNMPVQAFIQYIGACPATPGPLFILSTGAHTLEAI